MPWTAADASKHIKGLSPKQATVWARVANDRLKACEADGGSDCEGAAIRQANAAAKRVHEAAGLSDSLTRLVEVGRTISSDSEKAIRSAISALQALLARAVGGELEEATDDTTIGTARRLVDEYSSADTPDADDANPVPSNLSLLVERAVRRDGTIPIKIIEPGWGSSGYYPADVLKRDGPNVFKSGTKMYWDHPTEAELATRPERSLRDLAAELVSDARYDDTGPAGPGLYADAKVFGPYKETIEELAPHIGVSINAFGFYESGTMEGRSGQIVKEVVAHKLNSIDFVTQPGCGGQVVQLFESARGRNVVNGGTQLDEREAQQLREAAAAAQNDLAAARQQLTDREQELARMREALVMNQCRDVVASALSEVKDLPDPTRHRLQLRLSKQPTIKDGQLDEAAMRTAVKEAAAEEIEYINSLSGAGRVRGMGSSGSSDNTANHEVSLTEAFQNMGWGESAAKTAAKGR